MNVFVGLDDFKSLNVGFALDEGMTLGASLALKGHMVPFSIHIIIFFIHCFYSIPSGLANPTEAFTIFYGERGVLCK